MTPKDENSSRNIDTTNIFEEFLDDEKLHEEIDSMKLAKNKDLYYYLGIGVSIMKTGFVIFLFVVIFGYGYIWIQNNTEMKNKSFLDPLCYVFIGDIPNQSPYCSSIAAILEDYKKIKLNTAEKQLSLLIPLIEQSYRVNSFNKSKEVLFLLDKSKNRLKALTVLEAFDTLKNDYETIEKEKIQCRSLLLTAEIISMKCSAYTAGYENNITGFNANNMQRVRGTSISLANSFINYIEKKSDIFEVVNKQKLFSIEKVFGGDTNFTHRTEFNLELKYYYE